jgi:hypothetical protein
MARDQARAYVGFSGARAGPAILARFAEEGDTGQWEMGQGKRIGPSAHGRNCCSFFITFHFSILISIQEQVLIFFKFLI